MELTRTLTYPASPDEVASMALDPEFTLRRIARAGLSGAEVERVGDEVRAHITLDRSHLPSQAAVFLGAGENLVLVLSEEWRIDEGGAWRGRTTVGIPRMPVEVGATSTLVAAEGACRREVSGHVNVRIPLFGARIEAMVASKVDALLEAEEAVAAEWLAEHSD